MKKYYKNNWGSSQVNASVKHYREHKSLAITNNYFTSNTYKLAKFNQTKLWDRNKLIEVLIEKSFKPVHTPEPTQTGHKE